MKKLKIFTMACMAMALFSCSKENSPKEGVEGDKAELNIVLQGSGDDKSKADDASGTGDKDLINNYIVFLFNEDGALNTAPVEVADGNNKKVTTATTKAKKIYIVTNTGVLKDGPFKGTKNEADLKTKVGNLMKGSDVNASEQTNTNVWMVGEGAISYGTDSDANKATVPVTLKFIAAKIDVIVRDLRTKNNPKDDKTIFIEDKEVVLMYAGKEAKFFGDATAQVTQTAHYTGELGYSHGGSTIAESDNLKRSTALSYPVPETGFSKEDDNTTASCHFYTFGNDGTSGSNAKPTILAIKSSRKEPNQTAETRYFPVQFTTNDAKETIVPGNHYTVTITLKGAIDDGGGQGTTDPEEEIVPADIQVNITKATWGVKTVGKEFN